jgi:hypothetical protein
MTVVMVLTVSWRGFSCDVLIRMIRVPARPSRLKVISMPSARGDFGQPELLAERPSGERSASIR